MRRASIAHAGAEEEQASAEGGEVPTDGVEGVGKDAAEHGDEKDEIGEHRRPRTESGAQARSGKERERSNSILGLHGDGVNCGELRGSRFEVRGAEAAEIRAFSPN